MKSLLIFLIISVFSYPLFAIPGIASGNLKIKLTDADGKQVGVTSCHRKMLKIEFMNTDKANKVDVVLACSPYGIPITIYNMTLKSANEFLHNVKGKHQCLDEDGIRDCKEDE